MMIYHGRIRKKKHLFQIQAFDNFGFVLKKIATQKSFATKIHGTKSFMS